MLRALLVSVEIDGDRRSAIKQSVWWHSLVLPWAVGVEADGGRGPVQGKKR